MSITSLSDKAVIEIATPMIDNVVNASNQKDWEVFCSYQTEQEAQDPENRRNVENLWDKYPLFTSLTLKREILCVLRRDDIVQLIWKQTSSKVDGDYLARYFIKKIDGEVKEVGFSIN